MELSIEVLGPLRLRSQFRLPIQPIKSTIAYPTSFQCTAWRGSTNHVNNLYLLLDSGDARRQVAHLGFGRCSSIPMTAGPRSARLSCCSGTDLVACIGQSPKVRRVPQPFPARRVGPRMGVGATL
jgi:hypothetical protein